MIETLAELYHDCTELGGLQLLFNHLGFLWIKPCALQTSS